jgi:dephospho-CoA kinase
MKKPLVVGIVGGVASGKSEVTRHLQHLGAKVIHADTIGHEVLREAEVIEILKNRFGEQILNPDTGQIDRSKVAEIVFGEGPTAISNRRFLESVTHPRIRARIRESLDAALANPHLDVVVLDVPLLIESGWIDSCDRVVFVDSPLDMRRERAKQRGWSQGQFDAREASQVDIEKKRSVATDCLDNSGSLKQLRGNVEAWWKSIVPEHRS